jgi:hypothetical protein
MLFWDQQLAFCKQESIDDLRHIECMVLGYGEQNPTGYTLTSIMVRVRRNNSNTMMLTLSNRETVCVLLAPCSLVPLLFALLYGEYDRIQSMVSLIPTCGVV